MFPRVQILEGLKILDLSRIFTGPFASQILSDLGATVIKVEPPGGDDTRSWGPPFIKDQMSAYFAALNRNKLSIELNFSDDHDYSKLIDLVKWADVIIENYSEGVSENLKVDFGTLKTYNSSIIYLSISGFGSIGPFASHPSYDIIAQSESGIMGITGTEEGEITKVGVPIGDIAAGMYGVIGILSAVHYREKQDVDNHNEAIKIETNLFSALTSWLTYQSMNSYLRTEDEDNIRPMGTGHPNIVPYQSFLCKDNRWISIAVGNDKLWEKFLQMLDNFPHTNSSKELHAAKFKENRLRVEHRDALIPIVQKIFLDASSQDWYDLLKSNKIPVAKVNSVEEVLNHPQNKALSQPEFIQDDNLIKIPIFSTPLHFSNYIAKKHSFPPELNIDHDWISTLED